MSPVKENYRLDDLAIPLMRLQANIRRQTSLIQASNTLMPSDPAVAADLLRAHIVFLHASLEDYLREILRIVLPTRADTLVDIPPKGSRPHDSPKFTLSHLLTHENMTIAAFIRDSVNEYVSRETFNNTTDLSNLIRRLGLATTEYEDLYPKLNEYMTRRHLIVHKADLHDGDATEPIALTAHHVHEWTSVAHRFVLRITTALIQRSSDYRAERCEALISAFQSQLTTAGKQND